MDFHRLFIEKFRLPAAWILALALAACQASSANEGDGVVNDQRELIVLAAPRTGDQYYAPVEDDILAFHVAYAEQASAHDNVLILVDQGRYEAYVEALGPDRVAIAPQDDIWMRDFTLLNAEGPMMLRYTAAGQGGGRKGQGDADAVQDTFAQVIEQAGLQFGESDLLNDGGNFVDDYAGRAIVSRKFLRDNGLGEEEGRDQLRAATGVDHIAFIESDEQGGLEHADGVTAFIAPNVVVINSYPEDPAYAAQLRTDLEAGLPDVTIHEITTPYDGSVISDSRFGSACGLYTNMLVTPERIYLPQFGIAEDEVALASIRSWSDKEVVPVQSSGVCQMGGGVRCMSLQLRGENAARLLDWAQSQR